MSITPIVLEFNNPLHHRGLSVCFHEGTLKFCPEGEGMGCFPFLLRRSGACCALAGVRRHCRLPAGACLRLPRAVVGVLPFGTWLKICGFNYVVLLLSVLSGLH